MSRVVPYQIYAKIYIIRHIENRDAVFMIKPESVISVMMIITYIFEQMFCRFEGAMGLHCNREATRQMTKRWLY